ncbi:MAG: phage tail assembly chaperone [Burkholderiaceae bacterium]
MLKITPNPTFPLDVRVSVAGEKNPVRIGLTVRHKDTDALKQWIERASETGSDTAALLAEVIESWSGLGDAAGAPLAYSPEALATFLKNYPALGLEIFSAYVKELTEARLKN